MDNPILLGVNTFEQAVRNFDGAVERLDYKLNRFEELVERLLTGGAALVSRLEALEQKIEDRS